MRLRAQMGAEGGPRFEEGDAVHIISPHMPEHTGKSGTIASVQNGPYYAVTIDGEEAPHLWYAESELGGEPGAADPPPAEPQPPQDMPPAEGASALAGAAGSSVAAQARIARLAALGQAVLSLTGETDTDRAQGRVRAALESSAKVPGMAAELAQLRGAQDEARREALVAGAVPRKLSPGQAYEWRDKVDAKGQPVIAADGKPERVRALQAYLRAPHKAEDGTLRGQTLEQLEGYLAGLPELGGTASAEGSKADPAAAAAPLVSPQLAATARAQGFDPVKFAAIHNHLFGGASAPAAD